MRRPRVSRGGALPLFDRLQDEDPTVAREVNPSRTLSVEDVRRSVITEADALFNTRNPLSVEELERRGELTALEYGVPDLVDFSPQYLEDRRRMARLYRDILQVFEPRLHDLRITVEEVADNRQKLVMRVDGNVLVGDVMAPLSFPVVIEQGATGKADG